MKTSILILLSLFVSSVCFGLSGRIVLSFSTKLQSIEGSVFTNNSSDYFSLKTSDYTFLPFAVSRKALHDIKTSLSNAFSDSFDEDHFNSAFMKNVTDGETLKMNFGQMKKFFEDFLIISNCQITELSEGKPSDSLHYTRIYFYKED